MAKNKTVVITGGSTGIGKYLGLFFSQEKYDIVLISRTENKLKIVKDEIQKNGGVCNIIAADISKQSDFVRVSDYIKKNNNIDILINNAGIGIFNKIQNISSDEWDSQINTNLKGSFLMTKAVVPQMIKKQSGKIVFINSVAGLSPYPYSTAYVASKYGMRGFAASLREELREHNVKIISVHPGAIDTPFWNNVKADFPRKEMLSAQDVAKCILNAVLSPNNVVQEELVIRRTAGDF